MGAPRISAFRVRTTVSLTALASGPITTTEDSDMLATPHNGRFVYGIAFVRREPSFDL